MRKLPILGALVLSIAAAQQIVYTHAPDGAAPWPINDIYSMKSDGSSVRALTNDGHSHTPTWSPNGRQILFIHDATSTTKPPYRETEEFQSHHPIELFLMDADGGNRRLLRRLEPVIYSTAWSPDGKTLALNCLWEAVAGIYLLPANGQGEPRLLFRNAFTPAWSPDGKKIAFSLNSPPGQWSVHVANADGSHDVQLTDPTRIGGSPAWSPDGKQIAFDEFGGKQIFIMNAAGSHQRPITTDPNWSCGNPTFSPDGNQIAFSCTSASATCGGISSIGTTLPACIRRIFTMQLRDPNATPTQAGKHDGAFPAFTLVP